MAEDTVPALLTPSQPPTHEVQIRSISDKPKKRRLAPANSDAQKPRRFTDEEIIESAQEGGRISDCMQRLIEVGRGTALILSSYHDEEVISGSVAWGLAESLKLAVEEADACYFKSAGELNESISPRHLSALLKRKLKAVRAKIAKRRMRGGSASE